MKRVLIIDDETPVREALARFLAGDGHAVRSAPSLDAALAQLRRETVDLIICDVDDRAADIAHTVEALRAAASRPHLACVILTNAKADAVSVVGVTVVSKPIRLPELRALLLQAFQRGVA